MDTREEIKNLVNFIRCEVKEAGKTGCVVGVSGGIDSAVIIALCKLAFPDTTLGVLMPFTKTRKSTQRAREFCKKLGVRVYEHVIKIDNPVFNKASSLAKGNMATRARMAILYLHAEKNGWSGLGTHPEGTPTIHVDVSKKRYNRWVRRNGKYTYLL